MTTDFRLYGRGEMSGDEDDSQTSTKHQKDTVEARRKGNANSTQTKDGDKATAGGATENMGTDVEAKLRKLEEKVTKEELRRQGQTRWIWSLFAGVCVLAAVSAFCLWQIYTMHSDLKRIDAALDNLRTSTTGTDYSIYVKNTEYNADKKATKNQLDQQIIEHKQTTEDHIKEIKDDGVRWHSDLQGKLNRLGAGKWDGDILRLQSEFKEFKENIKTFQTGTTSAVSTLQNDASVLRGSLIDVETSVRATAETLQGEIDNTKGQLQSDLDSARENMLNDIKDMEKMHEAKIKEAEKALNVRYDSLGHQVQKSKEVVEDVLLPNAFNKEAVLQAFLLMALLGIALVFFYLRRPGGPQGTPNHGYQDGSGSSADKLNEPVSQAVASIPLNQPLQNAICAISFDKNTQALHQKLMEHVLESLPNELKRKAHPQYRTVLQHEDITRLPATKLYIMFVDFSERHVIIEQPGLGLGDTRRTTVQALERLRGELVMIYMHDLASRRLPTGRRYNRDIYCVKSQPKLKTLNNQGRFYSVYETLTDFQRQSLQSTIDDVFSE